MIRQSILLTMVAIAPPLLNASDAYGASPSDGYVGIRYLEQTEGLVVTEVVPGMPADAAGMVPGDLIVSIDGEDIGPDAPTPSLVGPTGEALRMGVVSPLGQAVRTIEVVRMPKAKGPPPTKTVRRNYTRFSGSLRRGPARHARAAAEALIRADYDGLSVDQAFAPLRRAAREHPRKARVTLSAIANAARDRPELNRVVGMAYQWLGDSEKSLAYLKASRSGVEDSLAERLGASAWADRDLASVMWDAGQRGDSIALTRRVAPLLKTEALWKKVGMATPTPTSPWEVAVEPLDDIALATRSGSPWRLSAQRGRPVAMVFWASWCGPCKKELPALAHLVRSRPDWPVEFIAVSVDKDVHFDKAEQLADGWDLPFPVAFDRDLGSRMNVEGLPAIRLIDGSGVLRSASAGYSEKSVMKLAAALDRLVEGETDEAGQSARRQMGTSWSLGEVGLRFAEPADALRQIAVLNGRVTAIFSGHGAIELPVEGGGVRSQIVVDEALLSSGDRHIAWLDGPISAGLWWLRARASDGTTRWFRTMSSPIASVVTSKDQLWVATDSGLTVFDPLGNIVVQLDAPAVSLAAAADGGVWAVDGERRVRYAPDGRVVLSDEAIGSALIAADGSWVGRGFKQIVLARVGPSGSPRVIALRRDGTIVGLDGTGQPALRVDVDNDRGHFIAVGDLDDDQHDELVLSSYGVGLATIELEIP